LLDLTPAARHALQFELGVAYEAQNMLAEALEQYQAVEAEDGSFRDVSERVQRLGASVKVAPRQIARPAPRPVAAPRKFAAQVTAAPAAARRPNDPPDPAPDPGRRKSKIGFV